MNLPPQLENQTKVNADADQKSATDPVLFEVIRNALVEATEEMSVSLQRTAYSTNIKTRLDYSCAFVDADGQMIAQAFCQPAHLVTIGRLVPRAVAEYGVENLNPGDALLVNDPHRQGSHLNDIFLISPFYYEDELIGYVANCCHHVDVGGGAPASVGAFREIYQEGIILPVVKLISNGEIVEDILKFVLANVRAKKEVAGDLRAQGAANEMGMRRLSALMDRYGLKTVCSYMNSLIDYSERRLLAELAKLPQGDFEAEGWLDDDGITDEPVHLKVRISLDGTTAKFDFTGTDPQRAAPMNCNLTQCFTACVYVLKCLVDSDIPVNEGFYRPIDVVAPEGSVVNVRPPVGVVGGWEVAMRLCDVMFKALSDPMPEHVPAGTKGMICHVGFGGEDPRTGEYYCFLETLAGGYGGRFNSDGPDSVQTHIQNTQNAPIEETELNYPVRIHEYSLVANSEGAGRYRGGLGLCREYSFVDHEPMFTTLADRARFPAWGLHGGGDGKVASYRLISSEGTSDLGSKATVQLASGDHVRIETAGGGGYEPPERRDPIAVLRDAREGKISCTRAREVYRVHINSDTWTIDDDETASLRQSSTPLNDRYGDRS